VGLKGLTLVAANSKRVCNVLVVSFALFILVFGLVRAGYELRWSGWAPGDAQTMSAARHFADEGFIEHGFLTYYHPGVVGSAYFLDEYYTHSPPLYGMVNGVILALGGGRYTCEAFSVFLSACALLLFYRFFSYFFSRPAALIGAAVAGLSVVFMEHMDGLSPQTYDIFLVSAAMALFAAAHRDERVLRRPRLRRLALAGVWLLVFLQACNSFEYSLFLQVFIVGYYVLSRAKPFPLKRILLFIAAPVSAFGLHFLQLMWSVGGFSAAWHDTWSVVWNRTLGTGAAMRPGFFPTEIFGTVNRYYSEAFGLGIWALLAMVVLVKFLENYDNPRGMLRFERGFSPSNVLLWLAASFLIWRLVMPKALEVYHPLHALTFVGLALGLAIALFWTNAFGSFRRHLAGQSRHDATGAGIFEKSMFKFGVTGLIVIIPVVAFLANTTSYLGEYPNEISPERTWGVHVSRDALAEGFAVASEVGEMTSYGDIVFYNLNNEWQNGAETFPMHDEYMGRRGFVLGSYLQETKVVPIENGDWQTAHSLIRPQYALFVSDWELIVDGLPDDAFLHEYHYEDVRDGEKIEYAVGIKNFNYRLARLRELREGLIAEGVVSADQIHYYALVDKSRKARPLQHHLTTYFVTEDINSDYLLVHLDEPTSFMASLEAYYTMGDDSGSLTRDLSGWNRHLSLQLDDSLRSEGSTDSAVAFEGGEGQATARGRNNVFGLYLSDELTVSFWVRPQETDRDATILALDDDGHAGKLIIDDEGQLSPFVSPGGEGDMFAIGFEDGGCGRLMVQAGENRRSSLGEVPADDWTHVTVVFDEAAGTMSAYLNGVLDVSYQVDTMQFSGQFIDFAQVGRSFWGEDDQFLGSVDSLAVFNQALSAAEVFSVYEDGLDHSELATLGLEQIVAASQRPLIPDWVVFSDMTVAPDQEANMPWQSVGSFEFSEAHGGTLTIKTSGLNPGHYKVSEPRFDDRRGVTAEVRMKLVGAATTGYQGACFTLQDGSREGKLTFYPDRITLRDQNDEVYTHSMSTGDGFHTYRLCIVNGQLALYVDGSLLETVQLKKVVTLKDIAFGDLSREPGENIHAEIDYIIYSTDAAEPPAPRPATLAASASTESKWHSSSAPAILGRADPNGIWTLGGEFNVLDCADDVVTLQTNGNNVGYFVHFDGGLDNSIGSSAEITLRMLDGPNVERSSFLFSIQDGTRDGNLIVEPDRIVIRDGTEDSTIHEMDTTGGFHTYRLALIRNALKAFVDDELVADVVLKDYSSVRAIVWGDVCPDDKVNVCAQVKRVAYTASVTDSPTSDLVPLEPPTGAVGAVDGMPHVTKLSDMRALPNTEQVSPWQAEGILGEAGVAEGMLTIATSGANTAYYSHTDDRFDNSIGATVEARIRVETLGQSCQRACVAVRDGLREAKMVLYPDGVSISDGDDLRETYAMDTTGGFHLYRMAVRGDTAHLYVDGELAVSAVLSNRSDAKGIVFGDLSPVDGENMRVTVDYVAYTVDGALSPDGTPVPGISTSPSVQEPDGVGAVEPSDAGTEPPSEWNCVMEMDVSPETVDEHWSAGGSFEVNQASDGVLVVRTSASDIGYIECRDDRLDNSVGTTVELTLRIVDASYDGYQGACFYVQDGTHEAKITFYPDRISIRDQNDERATFHMDTTDAFHVYRLAVIEDVLRVYVDSELAAKATLGNRIAGRSLLLGDLSQEAGENIHALVDYLAYSSTGAYAPDGSLLGPEIVESGADSVLPSGWTGYADMSVPPWQQDDRWIVRGNFDIRRTSGGVLTLKSSWSDTAWLECQEDDLDNLRGVTVEVRLKVVQAASHGHQGSCLSVQDGEREAKLTFYPDRVSIRDQNQEKSIHRMDTTDAFHTYRLTMRDDILHVYIDGFPRAIGLLNGVSTKGIYLGDLSAVEGENMHAEVDYLLYSVENTYPPSDLPSPDGW